MESQPRKQSTSKTARLRGYFAIGTLGSLKKERSTLEVGFHLSPILRVILAKKVTCFC
jgi:hypothetical protein